MQTVPEHDAALRLLRDLVENQFACFVGAEANLFELILKLRERPTRNVSLLLSDSSRSAQILTTLFATTEHRRDGGDLD